ncbi:MAG: bifunctional oligoribonuclease/PAP phosphatase NrnA [Clostridia bacterium]|nr:bifunctional oligoribonuclease/PAP phosphatase NrnA [Clostridia bacterium]
MRITKEEAASLLLSLDNILIFAHENPDGDAVGSACALCHGLISLGKKAAVWLDGIPKNDVYLTEDIMFNNSFIPEHIVTTDTADERILGAGCGYDKTAEVCLAIDHHFSNTLYAERTYLDPDSAAAGEVVYDLLLEMGVTITKKMAECIYIAISTDTGCFRFGNTKARTLRTAAAMLDCGIDAGEINRIQFETKTKEYVALEKMAVNSLKTYFEGKCAVMMLTLDMFKESGALECETQAISSLPRQIEGVYVGITMKEKEEGFFRISVRTNAPANAAEIASHLSGGGHPMAAGCAFVGNKDDALRAVLEHTENQLRIAGLL